jgi:thioredoxin reductase (NADPH)
VGGSFVVAGRTVRWDRPKATRRRAPIVVARTGVGNPVPGAVGPRRGAPVKLTLLTRSYCHLCDEMREALAPVAARRGAVVVEIDLDGRPEWEERFGARVPVLLLGEAPDGEVLAELALDAAALDARLLRAPFAPRANFR